MDSLLNYETVKYFNTENKVLNISPDYGLAEAHTTYGSIGVKVWIYKGDLLKTFFLTKYINL